MRTYNAQGNRTLDEEISFQKRYERKENNRLLTLVFSSLIFLTLAILLFLVLSSPSHYEKGLDYLHQKQYNEALVEFQKVDPDNKEFRMAQSKINYINGLKAFNDGLETQAISFLSKVEPADEYYHESQLMLDKLNLMKQNSLSNSKKGTTDTLIIKEKIVEHQKEESAVTDQSVKETSMEKNYVRTVDYMINGFQLLYQTARNSDRNTKKEMIVKMDSVYNDLLISKSPANSSPMITELQNLAGDWMQKSITYINSSLLQTDVNNPDLIKNKYDEEKAYTLMSNHLKKVKSFYSI